MVRPRRFRRISQEPKVRCFKPEIEDHDSMEPIGITIDEFEAIRLRDYHDIQQKNSAEIMEVSQPTFHRILASARKKIARALIEGNTIIIVGGCPVTEKNVYCCNSCGLEWISPKKDYEKCPECNSEDIKLEDEEKKETDSSLIERRSYGGHGVGAGPPRLCKCPECGYESPKTRGIPCKNFKCPQCETPLCGSE